MENGSDDLKCNHRYCNYQLQEANCDDGARILHYSNLQLQLRCMYVTRLVSEVLLYVRIGLFPTFAFQFSKIISKP